MRTKRIAATLLWFISTWYLGAAATVALGLPTSVALLPAVLLAVTVWVDPAKILWTQRRADARRREFELEPAA
jgi:hypothetical protein